MKLAGGAGSGAVGISSGHATNVVTGIVEIGSATGIGSGSVSISSGSATSVDSGTVTIATGPPEIGPTSVEAPPSGPRSLSWVAKRNQIAVSKLPSVHSYTRDCAPQASVEPQSSVAHAL